MTLRIVVFVLGIGLGLVSHGTVGAENASSSEPARYRYESAGRRDPFVPLVRDGKLIEAGGLMPVGGSVPVLHGILYDPGGNSLALLNDAEAKVGDTVDGYQVVEIRKDAVVLSGGGAPVVLKLQFGTTPTLPSLSTPKGGKQR